VQWKHDLSRSTEDFVRFVWPYISTACGGGKLKPVEGLVDNALADDLDRLCGIDFWQAIDGTGCRGIASRVQWGTNWKTFTIRRSRDSGARTEYEKLRAVIGRPGELIGPYLFSQAYVSECRTRLLGCGVARITDIMSTIDGGRCNVRRTSNASFFVVQWSDVCGAKQFEMEFTS